jgi:hypothetical protein
MNADVSWDITLFLSSNLEKKSIHTSISLTRQDKNVKQQNILQTQDTKFTMKWPFKLKHPLS